MVYIEPLELYTVRVRGRLGWRRMVRLKRARIEYHVLGGRIHTLSLLPVQRKVLPYQALSLEVASSEEGVEVRNCYMHTGLYQYTRKIIVVLLGILYYRREVKHSRRPSGLVELECNSLLEALRAPTEG